MNKKLIKSIVSITCGLGIATSIPFVATSCGSSSSEEKINPLPDTVYNIDANNVLKGFKEDIDLSEYDGICNAMQIPANVTSVTDSAFVDNPSVDLPNSIIPSFITKLTFEEGSNCSSIGINSFLHSPLTSVSFPSSLQSIQWAAFAYSPNLSSIIWDAWTGSLQLSEFTTFNFICESGTVEVTNQKDGHDSTALLEYLKEKCGLPRDEGTDWKAI